MLSVDLGFQRKTGLSQLLGLNALPTRRSKHCPSPSIAGLAVHRGQLGTPWSTPGPLHWLVLEEPQCHLDFCWPVQGAEAPHGLHDWVQASLLGRLLGRTGIPVEKC